jgi:protein involved in polysaccharide export with SLBB domain
MSDKGVQPKRQKAKGKRQKGGTLFFLFAFLSEKSGAPLRLNFCLLPFAFCLLFSCAIAQDDPAAKRKYTLFNGTRVFFSLDTDTPDVQTQMATRIQVSDINSVNRVLVDQKSGVFFGYTLKVEPVSGSNKYRVYLQPLNQEQEQKIKSSRWYEEAQLANINALTPGTIQSGRKPQAQAQALTPVTRFPAPQMIEDGDTIAVDVMVNPATGARIADRITISSRDLPPATDSRKPARDFTLDDIEMKISNYRLFINNRMVTQEKPQAGCSGPLIWFYVPGEGRFIFSIKPRVGYDFQRLGAIEDNKIAFSVNGKKFEWQSESPIVGAGGKWNLYVLHDAKFEPDYEEYLINPDEQAKKRILDFIRENCCLIGSALNMDSLFGKTQTFPGTELVQSRFGKNAMASALFNAPSSYRLLIQGAVRKPGVYLMEGRTTLLRLISSAGGLMTKHGPIAYVLRELRTRTDAADATAENSVRYRMFSIHLDSLSQGRAEQDIQLEPGDTISIPSGEFFYVGGEVNTPGEFPWREGVTLRQAIAMANLNFKAQPQHTVIFRDNGKLEREEIRVDAATIMKGDAEDVPVRVNDIIIIPRSPLRKTTPTIR